MNEKNQRPPRLKNGSGRKTNLDGQHHIERPGLLQTLLGLLEGHTYASAMMPWGKPGPIHLPDDADGRAKLVRAHIDGSQAAVTYAPDGRTPERLYASPVVLFALMPGVDGLCRWIGIDLDAADGHGAGGLVDPQHAARCISEQLHNAGLGDGLLVARSCGGLGRHVWLIPPKPCRLASDRRPLYLRPALHCETQTKASSIASLNVDRLGFDRALKPGRNGAKGRVFLFDSTPCGGCCMRGSLRN